MIHLPRLKEVKKARIGFYSAGLAAYWEQFAGLHGCLMRSEERRVGKECRL